MTVLDLDTKSLDINITNILNDLFIECYLICVGDKEDSSSIGELRAIVRAGCMDNANKLFPKRNRRPISRV
jgi:hypothetical protein